MALLPFAITQKFSFLSDKVIGAMFNLAIKLSLLSFICPMAGKMVQQMTDNMKSINISNLIPYLLQSLLTAGIVYLLSRKAPELVTSLLSGQPQLGGASMVSMAQGAAGKAAGAVQKASGAAGAVAGAAASAAAKGHGGVKGTLMELGKATAKNMTPGLSSYRKGMEGVHNLNNKGSEWIKDRVIKPDVEKTQEKHK